MEFMLMESNLRRNREQLSVSYGELADTTVSMPTKRMKKEKYYPSSDDESLSSISIFEECFSSENEDEMESPFGDYDEKFLLCGFDLVPEQNMPLNTTKMEIEKSIKCPNHHGKIALPWDITCRTVQKLDDVIAIRHDRMMITTATKPFHIEWINAAWSQFCGWSCEEVLGLDCKFLQGMGTDINVLNKFLDMLEMNGGFADMTIVNYSKYHTVLRNTVHCFPITDDCGFAESGNITHIGVVLLESQEIANPSMCDELIKKNPNLQFDRRQQCDRYPYTHSVMAPKASEFLNLTKDFTISLMLRYMMKTQAPMVILDKYGKILHTNIAMFELTRFRHSEVESVGIIDMLGKKSKASDVKKLNSMFESYEDEQKGFKKPVSNLKSLCNLELFVKHREGPVPNAFENFVRKDPAEYVNDEEPCEFCELYDANEKMMKSVTESIGVYASLVRFRSEHLAMMFSSRSGN